MPKTSEGQTFEDYLIRILSKLLQNQPVKIDIEFYRERLYLRIYQTQWHIVGYALLWIHPNEHNIRRHMIQERIAPNNLAEEK